MSSPQPAAANPYESPASQPSDAPAKPDGERTTTGSLLVIFLTVFIDLLGFGMVLPLLPNYTREFGALHGFSPEFRGFLTGLIMAIFSAMQFIFLPIWGRISDTYGRRPVIIVGLIGSVFCYGLFGIATIYRSLIGLFIARIGAGIAGA